MLRPKPILFDLGRTKVLKLGAAKGNEVLRKAREYSGMTAKELAYAINIHPENLTRMETAYVSIGELNARRFGEFFGCDWKMFMNILPSTIPKDKKKKK
jgi:plasmid maintenance system antidote protein VapI